MKKLLFALALTAFVGGSAVAHDNDKDKSTKKGDKKECSTAEKAACAKGSTAGGHSCCASKNKTASLITPKADEAKAEKPAAEKAKTL